MTPRAVFRGILFYIFLEMLGWNCGCQEQQIVYEVTSRFQRITVLDTGQGERRLIFDARFDGTDSIQSAMNLDNPAELRLSYARHIMAALPVPAKLRRILIVGLGGASMQRYLYRLLPDATIETAELDPDVLDVARRFFFYKEDGRQIVHLGDGRAFLENSKDKYDIIFLDAFSATAIPYHLATREFLKVATERITDGGIVCANLWDGEPDFPDMLRTYADVFPELRLLKCAHSGNSILLALPAKTGLTSERWENLAATFEKKHPTGLNLPQLIADGAAERIDIPASARLLLDKTK